MAMGERLRGFPLSLSLLSHGRRHSQRMARGPEDIQEVMVEPSLLQGGQRETEAVSLSHGQRRSQRMAQGPEDIQEVMVEPSLLQVGQRETEAVSLSLSLR